MDQEKIGRFIADRRRAKNLTQLQLAEMLNITDRAVSKWERGKAMPDASIMLELCGMLDITVNDLLCGEKLSMENYNRELENNLLEMAKAKEHADKRLLRFEVVIGCVMVAFALGLSVLAAYAPMEDWLRYVLIGVGFVPILVITPFMLKIEQIAGYYECRVCGHRYVPTYRAVNLSMHVGRTRYMKCPECGKMSWQRKVLSQNNSGEE